MAEEPKKKPAIYRCHKCKAEHRPEPAAWEDQSIELWRLGWKLVLVENGTKIFQNGYYLYCVGCAREALAA